MDCLGNASDTEAAGFTFASDSDHCSVQCPLTPGDTETFGGASRDCHGYVAMSGRSPITPIPVASLHAGPKPCSHHPGTAIRQLQFRGRLQNFLQLDLDGPGERLPFRRISVSGSSTADGYRKGRMLVVSFMGIALLERFTG